MTSTPGAFFSAARCTADALRASERGRRFNDCLSTCVLEWEQLPARGTRFDLKRPTFMYVMGRQLYLVAFVDLFGLMEVEHPAFPVQPWRL